MIFVFGSNLKGIHGAGAAAFAYSHHGAVWGQGEGLQGDSYALPTCAAPGVPLELQAIKYYVEQFLDRALRYHSDLQFQVTAVGCGIAGYKPKEIAPMFIKSPKNVWLPSVFYGAMYWEGYRQCNEDADAISS
jgi:hypothetical protein